MGLMNSPEAQNNLAAFMIGVFAYSSNKPKWAIDEIRGNMYLHSVSATKHFDAGYGAAKDLWP